MRGFLRTTIFTVLLAASVIPQAASAKTKQTTVRKAIPVDKPDTLPPYVFTGDVPDVSAASVLVFDVRTGGILYQKNADVLRAPASTQKLLTALIIAEEGALDRRIVVEPEDTQAEPTKLGFKPGDVYTRRELLTVLLVHSTNDGALALARDNAGSIPAFAEKMNRKAAALGMNSSHFVNPNGLPAPGQYSNARDMARLARAAYANSLVRSIVSIKELPFRYADGHVRVFKNTNRVLRNYPLCNGMKTGTTEEAGRCLIASGTNGGRDIIVVVLGDTAKSIWRDAYFLLAWGLGS
jgi:serine-type D-Ala-D-Ala carboxypeptidase (penicillin-binding protein 5/6)